MLLYILLDLNRPRWISKDNPLNNLQVFVNAFIASDVQNQVKIINSKSVILDSSIHEDFSPVFEYLNKFAEMHKIEDDRNMEIYHSLRITPQDLGYALIDGPDAVLIFNMTNELASEYLNYLKCMFAAQSKNVILYGFSPKDDSYIKMCCLGTKGTYFTDFSLKNLLSLVSLCKITKDSHETRCICCQKAVSLGLVCPICLAVYCKFIPVCKVCKMKFSFNK